MAHTQVRGVRAPTYKFQLEHMGTIFVYKPIPYIRHLYFILSIYLYLCHLITIASKYLNI
jgi:hypothetical protein